MTRQTGFSAVGIIGKHGDPGVGATLERLAAYLKQRQLRVIMDEGTARSLPQESLRKLEQDPTLETGDRASIGCHCDLAVVVGGDGTLLNAARSLVAFDVPLVGINLGHLGFLTDISPEDMLECLDEILAGRYESEKRTLLEAAIHREGELISHSDAFNDVVVHKWNVARMIQLEVYLDGVFVSRLRADGLIVSTPTGSTAYALSAGGPILDPQLAALVLVPVCPHTMSNRPLVVEDDKCIEVVVCDNKHDSAQVTCDGQITFGLMTGDRIRVRRKEQAIRLIHPADHNHYELLRAKLHWAENPRTG